MNLTDLGKVVAPFAPQLGAMLGGPAGALIGAGVASIFGGDIKDPVDLARRIQADPQAQIKLAEIQADILISAREADTEDYKTEVDDRKSARQFGSNHNIVDILAVLIIGGYFLLIYIFQADPEKVQGLRDLAFLVGAFYFGSSAGERRKASKD